MIVINQYLMNNYHQDIFFNFNFIILNLDFQRHHFDLLNFLYQYFKYLYNRKNCITNPFFVNSNKLISIKFE